MEVTRLFLRGWLIVSLTSANVYQIAHARYAGAFVCGAAISFVWWFNTGKAASDKTWRSAVAYALGAGCGTVTGLAISRWL